MSCNFSYTIIFACHNGVGYTKKCIESFLQHSQQLDRLVVVNNHSSDDTKKYLSSVPNLNHICNKENLGCGVAWNQGILANQSDWSIVMNNDVIVSPFMAERLIAKAIELGLKIISPAMLENTLDYDFQEFAKQSSEKLSKVVRKNTFHAVCMAIHKSVFQEIGYFRADPKLLGFEDALFQHAALLAGIPCAITGAVWIHHFGSITQTLMKQERGLRASDDLAKGSNFNTLLQQSWLSRKLSKLKLNRQKKFWRDNELAQYGMTLHGQRENGQFVWL